ncbi:hypothetical protein FH063_000503 [Azospirillum argentinense]|uniref:Uncharacterized protein n=1 Tax=Azospirillum argentinense TaxID=2970906 RepID=A0A5B0L398_9PROT|nr:hypothetical protein FH063_000503 [Azospirillum argentinense]
MIATRQRKETRCRPSQPTVAATLPRRSGTRTRRSLWREFYLIRPIRI